MTWITNPLTEQYAYKARIIGLSDADAQHIDRCARFIGPRTTYPNGEIYNQVWTYALSRACAGDTPFPRNSEDFAIGLVSWMLGGRPSFERITSAGIYPLSQVRDAYEAFLSEEARNAR